MTRFGAPRTHLVAGPAGPLEILLTGEGDPSTLFVHGLAGSISTTRPYATAVPGRRTFMHLRGHGRSVAPSGPFGYADLAAEVWSVADRPDVRADRALGVSMGAGAILAGLARDPDRFDRVVLVLPAAIDRPRSDASMRALETLAARVESGDVEAVTEHLVQDQPVAVRDDPAVRTWARGQAGQLLTSGVATALRTLPQQVPVPDRSLLARVRCPVLVLAQEGDDTHPVAVAEELAAALPGAVLRVSGSGGIMWADRRETRDLVGTFLAGREEDRPSVGAQGAHVRRSAAVSGPTHRSSRAVGERDRTQDVFVTERPWGRFRQFVSNEPVTVKTIIVEPGHRLSLQTHGHRAEMWHVLDGAVDVRVDDRSWRAGRGEMVWIPAGAVHRLGNSGDVPARLLEIAFGDFDEADITRLEDDYTR